MKDTRRKESARLRAEAYAPAPTDSRLLYGFVAASVALLIAVAAGAFYNLDLWRHLPLLSALAVLAFGSELIVRRLRVRRHRKAHRNEYDKSSA